MIKIVNLDIVIPVHNEEESIGPILREFHDAILKHHQFKLNFIVCEDGSKDRTVQVLKDLIGTLPIHLISGKRRKGYSRAVIDGMCASEAEYVLLADGDGQSDPNEFHKLFALMSSNDVVVGWRNPRVDPLLRIAISRAFRMFYRALFPVPLRDPSYAYMLLSRKAVDILKTEKLGLLRQGLFWELNARLKAARMKVAEVPVTNRSRLAGKTRIYSVRNLPRIAVEHGMALFALRKQLKETRGKLS